VEVDLALCLAGHNRSPARTGRPQTVGLHATKVELNSSLNTAECCIDRLACGHAPGQVWNRGAPVAARILVDANEIANRFHYVYPFNPACRLTDAKVPLGISSPRLPLTVTRPDLMGCLN